MSQLNGRLSKLEKQIEPPPKIVILWPGDPDPAEADIVGAYVIRVVYVENWREPDEPLER